jgi:rod shape-determining protein MreC
MKRTPSRSLQTVIVSLVVIGLIALALGGYLTPVSRFIISPLVSAQTWLSTRFQAIQNYLDAPQDLARLQQRNLELESEVSRLQAEVIELNQQISEARVLEALVDFARVNPENQYVAAEVIGRDVSPFLQYVFINRGSDNGLRRGMPVVTQQGLVGRIAAVTANAARVQLITDAGSNVNVRLEPSRSQATLHGDVTGELSLDLIPQTAEVKNGDLVLTSGLGGNFPQNIIVGQVASVRSRDNDLFQRASVQPAEDFSQLEIVLVITNFQPVDTSPLNPEGTSP